MTPKATSSDFIGRFREIVSDPLNMLIQRHERAGLLEDGLVYLHNGHRVPLRGDGAYYGDFSDILIINRGVHEPLEEYTFQQLLPFLGQSPTMLELGAYWGHYSMWLKLLRPEARTFLVEPDPKNLETGRSNFERHGYDGTFINQMVGNGGFSVDSFLKDQEIDILDILHCDIQGYEMEMLENAKEAFFTKKISYSFISTHSENLHHNVFSFIKDTGYRIEVSSNFSHHTTSFDGLIFASSPEVRPIMSEVNILGREDIAGAKPEALVDYIFSRSRSRTVD